MPDDQSTDETVDVVDFPPLPAGLHLSRLDNTSPVPAPASIYPLAPWRRVLILCGISLAIFCAIPAITPLDDGAHVFNGADLGVLLSLAMFVAAFTPWKD